MITRTALRAEAEAIDRQLPSLSLQTAAADCIQLHGETKKPARQIALRNITFRFKRVLLLLLLLPLTACGSAERITDADQIVLDCLASRAVVKLSVAVKTGLESDTLTEDPRDIQKRMTQEGLKTVKALFPAQTMHHHYYEFDVANRSLALQDALKTGDTTSDEYQRMTETLQLGETCQVEGADG